MEHEIACCREERMKNGKEYRQSIQQQIADLLNKAHLGNEERMIVKRLDSGKNRTNFLIVLIFLWIEIETLSPELLDAYDAEYERIHQLYEKRKSVLDAYEKWLTFWNDFVAFTVNYHQENIRLISLHRWFRKLQQILVVSIFVDTMLKQKDANEKNIFVNCLKSNKNS